MIYIDKFYTAELQDDGKLHWDDGDVWHLAVDKLKSSAAELPPWLRRRRPFRHESVATACEANRDGTALEHEPCQISAQKACVSEPRTLMLEEAPSQRSFVAAVGAQRQNVHRDRLGRIFQTDAAPLESLTLDSCVSTVDSDAAWPRGSTKAPMVLTPINADVHQGVVKWFRGSYGFLVCESVTADYPGCDVLLHKNECDFKPRQGDRVQFCLALTNLGNPQAVKVAMHGNH